MVNFWHSGGRDKDEADFPRVPFWHPDRARAKEAAARVLIELREVRGDKRDWVASGHPDPLKVGAGLHSGGHWVLQYGDLGRSGDENGAGDLPARSAAGAWQGVVDGEEMKRMLHEARRTGSGAGLSS